MGKVGKKFQEASMVDHPSHYNMGKYEVYKVIEDWKLTYNLGNVVKYVARSPYKGKQLEDLRKAVWYLEAEIGRLEREAGNTEG